MPRRTILGGRSTGLAGVGILAAIVWSGCSSSPPGVSGRPDAADVGDSLSRSTTRAFIGPDVEMRVHCGVVLADAPIASVDEVEGGCTDWSLSWQGDPAFTFIAATPMGVPGVFHTCATTGPTVASIAFTAPPTAVPGDTFDVVVTVRSLDGSFADGTVRVHALIVVPQVTVDKTAIDFGDVPVGARPSVPLNFTVASNVVVDLGPEGDIYESGPFSLKGGAVSSATWFVFFQASAPGDYTSSFKWNAPGAPLGLPAACLWTTTTTVHAHVPGADRGDAGSDVHAPSDAAGDASTD